MRRFNLLLASLGLLSFAATLAILHVTRGPLFRTQQQAAAVAPVLDLPTAPVRNAGESVVAPAAMAPAAAVASPAAVSPTSAAYPAPAVMPEPARAELVTLRAQIENGADLSARLNAVNSLRRMGLMGDEDGYVRASLRAAMNDPNPNVKSNAEIAYEMVSAQYGSQ